MPKRSNMELNGKRNFPLMETSFRLQELLSANGNFWLSASGNFCYQANTIGFLFGQFDAQLRAYAASSGVVLNAVTQLNQPILKTFDGV